MEIGALLEAISRKEGFESLKMRAQSRLKDDKQTAEKLGSGKFTFKGMLKSNSGKVNETQKLLQNIIQTEKDIVNFDILRNYLVIYLAEVAIPSFKHRKMKGYLDAMNSFCLEQIKNSGKHSECWSDFMTTIKKTNFK